ncbi:MAG TPA: hypothetical protein DCE41_13550 [Cytophagales bacterium]|nr:hypothetical protein [Cytophagales bacterium]HAA18233.1 hypothetical protein [Cytophagales bacterium]
MPELIWSFLKSIFRKQKITVLNLIDAARPTTKSCCDMLKGMGVSDASQAGWDTIEAMAKPFLDSDVVLVPLPS